MNRVDQAEIGDVCEAERYHFEIGAAYCLQNGTGLQRSIMCERQLVFVCNIDYHRAAGDPEEAERITAETK